MDTRTFQYRIYPTHGQTTRLLQTLDACRWAYNHLLEQRQVYWEEARIAVSLYDQYAYLPTLKTEHPLLISVHAHVLQDVAARLDKAFMSFFRRVKAGEQPGYPRYRGPGRYTSLTYKEYGNGTNLTGDQLYLSKIGHVRVVLHRPLEGTPKTVTVTCSSTGKWYVAIVCELEIAPLPVQPDPVGIDMGLHTFAPLSTGEQIANPRFFRAEEATLAKVQRKHATLEKGTPARRKHRKRVARVHERIKFKRNNHAHQHSRAVVDRFQVIAMEALVPSGLVHNHYLAKSISDAAWTQFRNYVTYKAAWAGRQYVAVNPAYTSQDCHACGHRQKMPLSDRTYHCPCCGLSCDRDHNAALNILARGLASIGSQSVAAAGL